MKQLIFTLTLVLFIQNIVFAQCNYTIRPLDGTTFCAGSTIRFTTNQAVASTDTLYWDLNGDGLADAQGDTATYIFPTSNIAQSYNVTLSLGVTNIPCDVQVVNTTPSVDPTITFQGGQQRCNGTQNVTIRIFNASTTLAQNTNYTINWGDGTPNYNAATLSTTTGLTHTYTTFGYKYITVTVAGSGGLCSATRVYTFYNGTNPSVGLANPGATTGLCVPATLTFPVTNTAGNTVGTTYALKISGTIVALYNHPAPPSVTYTFTTTSCGNTSLGGYANAFDVRLEAYNACDTTAATIEPIRISEPPIASISVTPPVTNCPGSVWTFTNTSLGQDASGSNCSRPAVEWSILNGQEFIDWQVVNGNLSSNSIGVQILTSGQFAIRIVTSSNSCGTDSTTLVLNPIQPPAVNVTTTFSNSANGNGAHCVPSTVFFGTTTTGDSTRVDWNVTPPTGWNFANGTNDTTRNANITFTQAGTYNISVSVINVCDTVTWDTTLVFSGVPTVALTAPANTCYTANLALSPANAIYGANGGVITGFNWSFPGGTPNSSNQQYPNGIVYNSPGTYNYFVTATSACGNATASARLIVEPPPIINVSATGGLNVCKGGGTIALVGTPAGGTWSGTGVSGNTFNPNAAGVNVGNNTVTYSYTNATGCSNQATLVLNVRAAPTVIASIPPVCRTSILSLTATPSSVVASTGFAWAGPNGFVSNIQSPTVSNAQPANAGVYTITVTDANGCTGSTTQTAVVNPRPNVSAGPAQSICSASTSLQLVGTPNTGGVGVWSNSPFITSNGVFNANAAGIGTYTVRYTFTDNATGCSRSATTNVTVTSVPTTSAGADTTVCRNVGVFTVVGQPSGGVWSGQSFVTAGGVVDVLGLAPNNYTLTYTINSGTICQAVDTRTITILPLPTPTASAATICESGNLQLNSSGGVIYSWAGPVAFANNQQNPIRSAVTLAMAGTYTVTVTNNNGCTASRTTLALINPQPATNAGAPQTICVTATTLQLNATPTAGGTGVWSGTNITSAGVFNPSAAGIGSHVVTYTFTNNGTGCSKSATTTVNVTANPVPNSGVDTSICRNSGSFTLYSSIGGGVYTGTGVSGNIFNPAGLAPANYTITYTLYGGTPCVRTDTRIITIRPLPTVTATSPAVCRGSLLSLTSSGGNTYAWAGPGYSSTQQNPTRTNAQTTMNGVYTVTVTTTFGCTTTRTTTVVVNPLPTPSAGTAQTICATATSLQLTGTPTTGGTGVWSGANISSTGLFNPVAAGVGSYVVTYTFTNTNTNCSNTATTTVTVSPNPVPDSGPDTSICRNTPSFNLYATISGGVWSGTGVTGNVFNPTGLAPANYTVTYTVFGGTPCQLTDTRTVTILALPVVTATAPTVCQGSSLALTSSIAAPLNVGGIYSWVGPPTFVSSLQNPTRNNAQINMAGVYTVTARGSNGCTATRTVTAVVNPQPSPAIPAIASICATAVPTQLTATPTVGGSGAWSGGAYITAGGLFDPVTAGVGSHTVYYTFTNSGTGCTRSASRVVTVTPNPVPNAGVDTAICRNSSAFNLYADISGGIWSGTGVTGSTFNPLGLVPANYTITYTLFQGTPCELIDTRIITIRPLPVVTTSALPVCVGASLQLNSGNTTVGSINTYSWTGAAGFIAATQNPIRTNMTIARAGIYTVTITNQFGCTSSRTVNVVVNPLPNPSAGNPQSICATAAPIQLNGTPTLGGSGVWTNTISGTFLSASGSFDPVAAGAGVYTVIYTFTDGTTGCSKSATTTVTVTPNPAPDAGLDTLVCRNSSAFNLYGNPSGGAWSGTNVSNGVFDPTGLSAGNYTITYTIFAATPCELNDTRTITILPLPVVTATAPAVCRNTNLSLTANGGVGYAWLGPNGYSASGQTIVRTNAQPTMGGTYTVTATDANACSNTATVVATITPLPNANAGSAQTICATAAPITLVGSPQTGGSGVWSGNANITSAGVFDPIAAGVGNYTVIYTFTDGTSGCSRSATTLISVTPNPIPDPGNDTTICLNSLPISLVGFPTGGVWSGTGVTGSTFSPAGLIIGNYTITYTILGGTPCELSATRTFTILGLPTPTASAPTVCQAANLVLNATGGVLYAWQGASAFVSNAQNPIRANAQPNMSGVYTVTVTNLNGCTASVTTSVTVTPSPIVSAGAAQSICATATSLQLNGSPTAGGSGVWSGALISATGVFNPSAAGVGIYTATYTFTDAITNCSKAATTTITVTPNPAPDAGPDTTICRNSGSVILYANIAGGTWSGTGVSGNIFNPSGLAPANYTLTYTLFAGTVCEVVDTRVLTILPLPTPTATAPTVCQSATLSLNSTGGSAYAWAGSLSFSSTAQNPNLTNAQTNMSGTYTVTVTDANGCTDSKTVVATVNPQPTPSAGAPQSICATSTPTQLNGTPVVGGSGVWSGGAYITATGLFDPIAAGIGTYTVYYTFTNNGTGCSKSASTLITVTPNPAPNAGADTTVCSNSGSFAVYADISGGVWSGTGITGNTFNSNQPAGNYTLTYTIFPNTPCARIDTRVVTIRPLPIITVSAQPVCVGASLQLNSLNSPVSGVTTYSWTGAAGFVSAAQNPIRTNMTIARAGVYTVTITNQFGCKNSKTVNVVVNPLPNSSAGTPQSICATAAPIQLNGTPVIGGSGVWTSAIGGSFVSSGGVFDPVVAGVGIYTVIYTFTDGTTGCSKSATTTVTVTPNPAPDAGFDTLVCSNSSAFNLYGSPSGGTWTGTNITNSVFDPSGLSAGNYTLIYTIFPNTPCALTDTRTITILPLQPVSATAPAVCRNANLSLTANGGIGYAWLGPNGYSANGQTIVRNNAQPTIGGTYTVTATDANGCSNSTTVLAIITPLPNVNAGAAQSICATAQPITIVGTPQIGGVGVWAGNPNITSAGVFNPIAAGVGTYIVNYTFTDATTGCSNSATTAITVTPNPAPDPGNDTTICLNTPPIALVGFPTGGVWSGTGVSGSTFSSAGLTAGNYTVTYTILGGTPCELAAIRTFTILALPNPTASAPTVCQTANLVLSATGGVLYAWQGASAFVSNAQNPIRANAQPNMSGVYTVTVTDLNGCTASVTTSATVTPSPIVSAGAPQSICATATSLQLNGSPQTGGNGVWSGAFVSATGVFDPSAAGVGIYTATYTFTDAVTNCSKAANVTITVTPNPMPNAGVDTTICRNSGSFILYANIGSGTWSGTGVSGNIFNPSGLSPANYTLTYTLFAGTPCELTDTRTLTILPLPTATATAPTVCQSATLSLNSTGGSAYTWAGPLSFSSTAQNPNLTNAQTNMSGVYTVTVTDANGCTNTQTVTATVNPQPTPSAGAPQSICATSTPTQLNGTPTANGSGVWSGGAYISATGVFDPIAAGIGTYTVYYTFTNNGTGCSKSASTLITVTPNPAPNAGADTTVCRNSGSFAVYADISGGVWSGTGITGNTFNTNQAAGNYILTYTIFPNTPCALSDTRTITILALPAATATAPPVCRNTNLSLSANGGVGYAWLGPNGFSASGQTIVRNNAQAAMGGTYTVTVTDANGCSNITTVLAVITPLPVVNAGTPQTVCATAQPIILVGTPQTGGVGVWAGNPNITTAGIFNPIAAGVGTYIVNYTFTDGTTGCSNSATTAITVTPNPAPDPGNDTTICLNSAPITLVGFPTGGVWTGSGVNGNTFSSAGLSAGIYTVTYTILGGTLCEITSTRSFTVLGLPTPTASAPTVCQSANLVLNATGGVLYNWQGAAAFVSNAQSPIRANAQPNMSGVYTVTATDLNGCTASTTTSASVTPSPIVSAGAAQSICATAVGLQLNGSPQTGGSGIWSGAFVSPLGVFDPSAAGVGTFFATYTFTDATTNCSRAATTTITVTPNPAPDAGLDTTICVGSPTISLIGSPSGGTWSGTGTSGNFFNPASLIAGNYTLTYTIFPNTPCELSDTKTITIVDLPTLTAAAPSVCRNADLTLSANGTGIGYDWLGPNGFSSSGQTVVRNNAQASMGGVYTVITTNINGCINTATVTATITPLPNTNAGQPQTVCATAQPITLVSTPQTGGTGVWAGNPNITPQGVFNPITAGVGTYVVNYTFTDGITGCSKSATTTITVTPNPLPDAGNDTTICLNSQPIPLVGIPAGGTWTGSGVNGTNFNPSGLTAGNYTLTYTILGGTPCELTNTRTFTILALPNPTASIPPVCQGTNLVLNATGGVIYAWQGAAAFVSNAQNPIRGNAQPNMSGNYTVTVTDSNGCTASASTTTVVSAAPVVGAGAPQSICETATSLQLNGSPTTGGNGVWSGAFVSPLGVFDPSAAGIGVFTATYTFTDAVSNCSKAANVTITVTPNPLPNPGQDTLICLNSPTVNLVGSPSGGVWSGTGVSGNFFNVGNLSANTYTLTYTINQGTPCVVSTTKTITIAPLPTPTITANTVCRGFDLVLTSSGGNTYNWAGPAFFSSILQNPTRGNAQLNMAGNYTVTVTDVNLCTASISANAIVHPLPTVGAGAAQTICETALPIQLNGSPQTGGSGVWSGGAFISPSGAFDPVAAGVGTYVVVYTFTNATTNCSNSATTTVSVTPNPAPDADVDVAVCFGSPLFALGGSPAGGTWTGTGVTANTFNPLGLAVGSYVLTYTINGGTACELQDQKTVTIQPLPVVITGNNAPICAGDTLRLTATAGNIYAWAGPDNFSVNTGNPIRANATVAMNGIYTVTVTDGNNCVNSNTTSVLINALPVVNAGPARSNCNTILNDTIVGFTPTIGGTGVWSGSQFVTPNGIFTVQNTPIGDYLLTYTFTDLNACVNSDTTRITVYDNPLANAGLDFSICNNVLPTTLVGTPAGGDWTGQNVSNGTFNPVGLAPGVYPLIYYTFRGQRCETRDTVLATVLPLPTPTASNNTPICAGFDINLTATGGQNYNWTGANGFTSIVFNPTIIAATVNASGIYTVTVTDANNCTNTTTTEVIVYPLPLVTTAPTLDLCNTIQDYQLTGFAPISGSTGTGVWSGPFVSATGLFSVAGTNVGGYNLTYTFTDINGCINSADQVVNIYDNPIANAGPDLSICNNLTPVALNGTPSGGVWTGSGVSNGFFDPRGLSPNVYELVYQTFPGQLCQTSDTMRYTVLPLPIASAQNTSPYCVNDAIQLQAAGGNNYEWSGPDAFTSLFQNPVISTAAIANAGIYTVTVTDANLCTNSATTNVIIRPLPIVDAGQPQTVCNTWTTIQVTGAATTAGVGSWSGTGVSATGVFTVQGLPVGDYFLTYTFTDTITTCVNIDTVTITIIPNIAADAGLDQETCFGTSQIPLVGTPAGGSWTGTGVFNNTFDPAGLQPGDYTLYYNLGLTNCFTKDSMIMTIKPLPVLSAISNTPCENGNLQILLTANSAQSYSWSGPNGYVSSAQNPSILPAPLTAAGVYTVTVVALNGCTNTTSLLTNINPLPNVTAGNDPSICRNIAPYTLTGYAPTTGGTGSWSGVGVTANGVFDANQVAGVYPLTYTFTDGNGCTDAETIQFTITPNQVPVVGNDTSVCINSGLLVLAATPANGIWTGNGIQNNLFNPQTAGFGTHTLTYTTNTGTICALNTVLNVTVNPLPVVSAGLDRVACVSEPNTTLIGIPTGGVWTGSTGAVIAGTTFSPQQSGAGIFTMVYNFSDANNCAKSDTMIFRVNPLPIVVTRDTAYCNAFGLVPLPSAVPLGGVWTGPGVIPPLSFAPTAAGIGTHLVTYTYTDGNGCINTATSGITVTPIPTVDAGPNDTLCIDGGTRNMNGQIPATGGFWTGNGIINPNVGVFDPLVAGAGTWTLTYTFGQGNCRTSDTKLITVVDIRQVFAGPDEEFCISQAPFNLAGYSPQGGRWLGAGITDPIVGTYAPLVAGVGIDTLYYTYTDALSQCSFTDIKLITINPLPNPQFAMPDTICVNTNFTISNQTFGAAASFWTFGDGTSSTATNPVRSYTTEGTYPIKLVVRNPFGCIDSLRKNITVLRPPFAQAIVNTPDICEGTQVNLINQSSGFGIRYFWQLPNGTTDTARTPATFILPTFPRDTTVNAYLTVTNRCGVSVDTVSIRVRPTPHVGLTPDRADICSGSFVYFQNLSTGGATTYLWDLGNGNTFSGLIPPPQMYFTDTLPRTFTITLIGSNACGSDTVTYPLLIKPADVRAFIFVDTTRGCGPLTVQFTDFSTSSVATTFTHSWDFGDGGTSTDPNPVHTFLLPGNYTVIEYVGTNCGTDTDTIQIEVLPPPAVSFTVPSLSCARQGSQFLNTSTTQMASFWQFSDTDTTSVRSPYKIFAAAGTYSVTLTGTSQFNGCTASATGSVTVNANPTPTFNIQGTQGCRPLEVSLVNGTTNGSNFVWEFGDGNSSTAINPTYSYDTSGTFIVKLRAYDVFGCYSDTAMAIVNVYPIPNVAFNAVPRNLCGVPTVFDFVNNTTGANGFDWSFGNGITSNATNPIVTYTTADTFAVTLIANNQYGCPDTLTKDIVTRLAPTANFSVPRGRGCSPYTAIFEDQSSGIDGWFWDFGDGTNSTLPNPIHTYSQAGNYDVVLTVNFGNTCFDTIRFADTIRVYPSPVADFIYTTDINNFVAGTVNFTSQATPVTGAAHWWDFGDGTGISEDKNPTHRYFVNGGKAVQLIVQNIYGCRDTIVKQIIPEYFEGLWVPSALSPESGVGDVQLFKPKGVGIKQYRIQVFTQWGELLWESDKLQDGQPYEAWDGTYNGKIMPQDVYVWRCEAVFESGNIWNGMPHKTTGIKSKVGNVTLLR